MLDVRVDCVSGGRGCDLRVVKQDLPGCTQIRTLMIGFNDVSYGPNLVSLPLLTVYCCLPHIRLKSWKAVCLGGD